MLLFSKSNNLNGLIRLMCSSNKAAPDFAFEIVPQAPPKLLFKGKRFICSEKFRVNSQGTLSDVWLIYKSETNNATWNMTILSRINLNSAVSKKLFENFQCNDKQTAWDYAFNADCVNKAGAIFDTDTNYVIKGPGLEDILDSNKEKVRISISCKFFLPIKVKEAIARSLGISSGKFVKFVEKEVIIFPYKNTRKFGNNCEFELDITKMKCVLDNNKSICKP